MMGLVLYVGLSGILGAAAGAVGGMLIGVAGTSISHVSDSDLAIGVTFGDAGVLSAPAGAIIGYFAGGRT